MTCQGSQLCEGLLAYSLKMPYNQPLKEPAAPAAEGCTGDSYKS
jgi:hypothetical protein